VALLTQQGRFDQLLERRTYESPQKWGELDGELLLGTKGAGAGVYARTNGRTFLEGTATAAMRGLPLASSDAPLQIDVARQVSQNVTIRTGFVSGYQLGFTPFASLNVRDRNATFSATLGGGASQLGASYLTDRFDGQIGVGNGPGGRWSYLHATAPLRGLTLNLQSLITLSSRDTSLELQTQGRSIDFFTGVESVGTTTTRLGPVVGVSMPIFPGLATQIAFNPTTAGNDIRFGLVANFKAAEREVVRNDRVTIGVAGGDLAGPMTVYVDGEPRKGFSGSSVALDIVRGTHLMWVETNAGTRGSPEARIDVHHGSTVSVSLAPLRTITGYVRVDAAAAQIPSYFRLSAVTVLLQPWGQVATVDANGAFTFSKQVIGPDSMVLVDPSTIPNDLELLHPAPVADDGRADLTLVPKRKIEQHFFPSH
jgi:hypothetical protein